MISDLAIIIYGAIKENLIKSRSDFWKNFAEIKILQNLSIDIQKYRKYLSEKEFDVICTFDNDFPKIDFAVKNSDKPFLFVYKGDVDLLNDIKNNVAVIGVLNPTQNIIEREKEFVKVLVNNKQNIVSGLASGCDTVAHKTCLECGGKTVAFLPTTLDNVYPKQNKDLVNEIVENGGLVITEYAGESENKYENIKRFIDRDRLQAMFSKAVVLTASFSKGKGDSGSRHAMQKAIEYGKPRYVMYNGKTDCDESIFELNREQIKTGAKVLTKENIVDLCITS